MVLFLFFATLALAGMVVASVDSEVGRRELKMESNLEKRDTVECSDSSQSSFISASLSEGKSLASQAANYINTFGTSDPLFTSYFGNTTSSIPFDVFTNVANENLLTLSCSDPWSFCAGNPNAVAYAVPAMDSIFYCSAFYNQLDSAHLCSGTPVASLNIRGGTTLVEITLALNINSETVIGCSNAQNLASSNPAGAMSNADNYECFALQVYANTQCS